MGLFDFLSDLLSGDAQKQRNTQTRRYGGTPLDPPDEFPAVEEPFHTASIDPDASTDKTTMVRLYGPDGEEVENFRTRGTVHAVRAHPEGDGLARIVDRGRGVEAELVHTKGDIVFKAKASPDSTLEFTQSGILQLDGKIPKPKKPREYHSPEKDILRTVSWYRNQAEDAT